MTEATTTLTRAVYVVAKYAMNGRWRVILKTKKDAIKGIPKMWGKRRLIQAQRKVSAIAVWRILDKRIWSSRLGGNAQRTGSIK